jgi:hypothetical protein
MNEATYQSYLAAKQAYDEADKNILNELVKIAGWAGMAVSMHPEADRIKDWIENAMGFDGCFDRHHAFQYGPEGHEPHSWSRLKDEFSLNTREICGEHYTRHYAIPEAWVFADDSERIKLIKEQLDSIAAQARAHDKAREQEQNDNDRIAYERLRERFGS